MDYLDFEKPIEEIVEKLDQAKHIGEEGDIDVSKTLSLITQPISQTQLQTLGFVPWHNEYI